MPCPPLSFTFYSQNELTMLLNRYCGLVEKSESVNFIGKENKMKGLKSVCFLFFTWLSLYGRAFAQEMTDEEAAVACAACGGGFVFFIIAIFVINIVILIWVARDAKARGMGNPVGWLILIFFTSFIGLIIYFFSRPKGELEVCPNCKNKRLKAMAKCPHCGN